jgi:hypothetical protein
VEACVVHEVLLDGEEAVDARMLEDDPEPPAHRLLLARHFVSEDARGAVRDRHESREELEERALAAAVRPEEAEQLAASDPEAHAVERDARAVAVPDPFDLDRGRGQLGRRRSRSRRSSASVTR